MFRVVQGSFGSVYVAMWKGLVVAVKVMKHQLDSRRAMRTAWELAVTKSLSHPNVVMVSSLIMHCPHCLPFEDIMLLPPSPLSGAFRAYGCDSGEAQPEDHPFYPHAGG